MFYRVLTILFIIGILAFTYFLAYYIFYPAPEVDSFISNIKHLEGRSVGTGHLPQQASKTVSSPEAVSVVGSAESKATVAVPGAGLTFGDQFDNFSNAVYINQTQSSLYEDTIATAIFYPPIYSWKDASGALSSNALNFFNPPAFNDFMGPYQDRKCLANDCLIQTGNDLYYKGQKLVLPAALQSGNLKALSIDTLNTRWVVGATLQTAGGYLGLAYYFNGRQFTQINTPAPVQSAYFGLWGFGGSDHDFLMIYGAYKGLGYHVNNNTFTDISSFFSYRAMNNSGYRPEIIRAAVGSDVNWYIYSATLNRPWFFKLWQNGTPHIVGEAFFNEIFSGSLKSAAFQLLSADSSRITLLAKTVDANGHLLNKLFIDQGFNNSAPGILVSKPLDNSLLNYQITIYKIYDVNLDLDAGSKADTKFLFSNDGQNWQSLIGKARTDLVFPATPLYLKVVFPAETNRFYSPYLNSMLFSYYWQKSS